MLSLEIGRVQFVGSACAVDCRARDGALIRKDRMDVCVVGGLDTAVLVCGNACVTLGCCVGTVDTCVWSLDRVGMVLGWDGRTGWLDGEE